MAKKYYAVCVGRIPGIYDNWDKAKAQVDGFKNAKYKSFLTEKEAITYMTENTQNEAKSVLDKKENKRISTENGNKKANPTDTLSREKEMIKDGSWEKYLFENITCEDLSAYDALCVSDACDNKEDKSGAFGLIMIPLKDGKRCGDIIVESALLKDMKKENGELCEGKFERRRFDIEGKEETKVPEVLVLEKDLYDERGYVAGGEADRAESEGATRVLEFCKEKGYANILYICDCQPLLQAINKGESKAVGNMRVLRTKGNITMEVRKVGSHKNAYVGDLKDDGKDPDKGKMLGNSHVRLFYLLNDLTDLMAKAEVSPKRNGDAKSENWASVHLIPDENGNYITEGKLSDMEKIYKEELNCEERRYITRQMVKRVIPLIDKALENSQA